MRAADITTIICVSIAGASVAQESVAQVQVPGAGAELIEEQIITGSHIVRDSYDTPTPVTVFGAEDLEMSANTSLLGALDTLPALSGSQTNGVSHGRQGESLGGMQ